MNEWKFICVVVKGGHYLCDESNDNGLSMSNRFLLYLLNVALCIGSVRRQNMGVKQVSLSVLMWR